jgi:bifunctional non-homologous end joining protein LigD
MPARTKTPRSRRAPARRAQYIEPMKALGVEEVPAGRWKLELKYDGFRAVAVLNGGDVELWSRNHRPLGPHYPEVVEALGRLPIASAVLDGELVALDESGLSRFQLLQGSGLSSDRAHLVYYVFDLMEHEGVSLVGEPLETRQALLAKVLGKSAKGAIRRSPVFDLAPEDLLAEVQKRGGEGIIAKAPGSLYESGRRSGAWLKCKVNSEQEFVIGGFTPPQRSRPHFGAILVGYYDRGELRYAGKVGSGFNRKLLASLHAEFRRRRIPESPFVDLPLKRRSRYGQGMTAAVMKQVTWVKPELVAQVRFTEWTNEGSLRHPVFLGLRHDKRASEVVREAAAVQRQRKS